MCDSSVYDWSSFDTSRYELVWFDGFMVVTHSWYPVDESRHAIMAPQMYESFTVEIGSQHPPPYDRNVWAVAHTCRLVGCRLLLES